MSEAAEEDFEEYPRAQSIAYTKTELPPCALRYHPLDSSLILLGTYKLQDDRSRTGTIELYHVDADNKFKHLKSFNTDGAVLDLKFCPFDDSIVYTAHSTGDLQIWRFDLESRHMERLHKEQILEEEEDVLITSVITSFIKRGQLLLTATDGSVAVVQASSNGCSTPQFFSSSHELQAWTGAFGHMAELSNVIFTGGDDGFLKAHDLREPSSTAIFETRRLHDAGVTAIQTSQPGNHHGKGSWLEHKPYSLWTGSYDDNVRLLDLRVTPDVGLLQGIPPRIRDKMDLGGGVWRFAPSPTPGDNRLLTCCMYDGARILCSKEDESKQVQVLRYYKGSHESMVYGCDWSPQGDKVATCSFYDGVVHIWSPDQRDEQTSSDSD
ncbi:unnamed protein product [Cyberlindnera jadinii]|uniref:methylated diphthine methylhydrolase n=1 Tax=Cyberlindnera jadinii (strain ATCC 18201 / CBS 1600 / BCRC 20928 / JCM 3617 / NBRC 0987 / NRRL Y-1542) TaxID=983966 RepID=A0A0H5C2K2_CYBJN|nr:WD40 repeat-like protein [Cyberlindnera jadinii NRRL Y-1542]ODV72806.1 WD40 repeat-like protein [Cyberlindnera jadinii NRRL Y-1542]CEP22175.1 unnamed protein product [Cyberlindnera jadinii]